MIVLLLVVAGVTWAIWEAVEDHDDKRGDGGRGKGGRRRRGGRGDDDSDGGSDDDDDDDYDMNETQEVEAEPDEEEMDELARQRAENIMQSKIMAQNIASAETTESLDDEEVVLRLETDGITIGVGDEYYLKVNENPSTGFVWNIDSECEDAQISSITGVNTKIVLDDPAPEDGRPVLGQ